MEQRPLGTTELQISPVGIGTAVMGRDPRAWGPVDDNESIAAIHAGLESGINWIETAPWHGAGHAEEVAGRALQGCRQRVLIVGCLETPSADALGARRESVAEALTRDLEASLRRLRSDFLDVCLCRVPEGGPLLAETVGALGSMLAQGKLRAMGPLPASIERMNAWSSCGALHVTLGPGSLIEPAVLRDVVPTASRLEAGFLACSPLCRGLLSGRVNSMSRFGDLRARDPQFLSPRLPINVHMVESLAVLAERRGETPAHLAISWVISRPGVTGAVVGVKRASQIRDLAKSVSVLGIEEQKEIEMMLAERDHRLACET